MISLDSRTFSLAVWSCWKVSLRWLSAHSAPFLFETYCVKDKALRHWSSACQMDCSQVAILEADEGGVRPVDSLYFIPAGCRTGSTALTVSQRCESLKLGGRVFELFPKSINSRWGLRFALFLSKFPSFFSISSSHPPLSLSAVSALLIPLQN